MKPKIIALITTIFLLIGLLFFLVHRKILVVQLNHGSTNALTQAMSLNAAEHKTVRLYYKKNNAWTYESISLIWRQDNDALNLKNLIQQWLVTVIDEHMLPSNIAIESIALATPGSDLYISFDRTLFHKDADIMSKWNIVESIIKTVHHAHSSVQAITLQVHHGPMLDDHLELTQAIPVQEFCS